MTLPPIAQHAKAHGITPIKQYGQNFLFDFSLCQKIVRASNLAPGDIVLEIGPGVGGLTRAILECMPSKLTVIETDRRCIPLLEEIQIIYPNLDIIKADALKIKLESIANSNITIISNLPYNVGTELFIRWIKDINLIKSITVMLQKEVVDRIKASPNTKAYGRLSVIAQLLCKVNKCFDVSPLAFYPPPKVDSSVMHVTSLEQLPNLELVNIVENITQAAFGMRRKMLKTSLRVIHKNIDQILLNLEINPMLRAENITPSQYLAIANAISNFDKN